MLTSQTELAAVAGYKRVELALGTSAPLPGRANYGWDIPEQRTLWIWYLERCVVNSMLV
jgi:hypothetical protein